MGDKLKEHLQAFADAMAAEDWNSAVGPFTAAVVAAMKEKKPKAKAKRRKPLTYSQATQKGVDWPKLLQLPVDQLLAAHPWTAANMADPVGWCRRQIALTPDAMDVRAEVIKALNWMEDNQHRTGGRTSADQFLSRWLSRARERGPRGPANGNGKGIDHTPPTIDLDDPDAAAKLEGGGR